MQGNALSSVHLIARWLTLPTAETVAGSGHRLPSLAQTPVSIAYSVFLEAIPCCARQAGKTPPAVHV